MSSSTSSALIVRVFSFVPSSASHQALWSDSPAASSRRRVIMSRIILLTLPNGSSRAFWARRASSLLPVVAALLCSSAATLFRASESDGLPRSICTRDAAPSICRALALGRCSVWMESPPMISMALEMASISWPRRVCRLSKSTIFCMHMAVMSARYASPAALDSSASAFSPSASALSAARSADSLRWSESSLVASSSWSASLWETASKACFAISSSLSRSLSCPWNLVRRSSSILTTGLECDSYAFAAPVGFRSSRSGSHGPSGCLANCMSTARSCSEICLLPASWTSSAWGTLSGRSLSTPAARPQASTTSARSPRVAV
mmetsp:Transcript_30338/g.80461  ORF Transcript_30338/g.80461 Transcript_30338/m.80461 type:complete len:321 (+) Transcript_30338:335-1297(+)